MISIILTDDFIGMKSSQNSSIFSMSKSSSPEKHFKKGDRYEARGYDDRGFYVVSANADDGRRFTYLIPEKFVEVVD